MHTFNVHISTSIDKSHILAFERVRARTHPHIGQKNMQNWNSQPYILLRQQLFFHTTSITMLTMITSDFHIVTLSWLYACCILLRRNFFVSLILFETKVFTEMWDNCQVLNIMKRQPKKIVYGSMIGVCGCALCIAQNMYKWLNEQTNSRVNIIGTSEMALHSPTVISSKIRTLRWCQINFKILCQHIVLHHHTK